MLKLWPCLVPEGLWRPNGKQWSKHIIYKQSEDLMQDSISGCATQKKFMGIIELPFSSKARKYIQKFLMLVVLTWTECFTFYSTLLECNAITLLSLKGNHHAVNQSLAHEELWNILGPHSKWGLHNEFLDQISDIQKTFKYEEVCFQWNSLRTHKWSLWINEGAWFYVY